MALCVSFIVTKTNFLKVIRHKTFLSYSFFSTHIILYVTRNMNNIVHRYFINVIIHRKYKSMKTK